MRTFQANTQALSSAKCWNRAYVRAIAPRKHAGAPGTPDVGVMGWNLRVLPTRTRPSLFGSD